MPIPSREGAGLAIGGGFGQKRLGATGTLTSKNSSSPQQNRLRTRVCLCLLGGTFRVFAINEHWPPLLTGEKSNDSIPVQSFLLKRPISLIGSLLNDFSPTEAPFRIFKPLMIPEFYLFTVTLAMALLPARRAQFLPVLLSKFVSEPPTEQ